MSYKNDKKGHSRRNQSFYYGTSITYVFALEAGTEYSIKVNNPTNEHEGEYDIYVSEDNWVYAPEGALLDYIDEETLDIRLFLYFVFKIVPGEFFYNAGESYLDIGFYVAPRYKNAKYSFIYSGIDTTVNCLCYNTFFVL